MGSRRLEDLNPIVEKMARALLVAAEHEGIQLLVTSTLRTYEEQAEIYAQGRTRPGKRVTNARPGYSWHNFGLAFDVVPLVGGKPVWNSSCWSRIGVLGRGIGLIWGGDFCALKDLAHFEYHPQLDLAEARRRRTAGETMLA
ncbi:MAG: M15 family metallopeptidase [Rhodospirillales bacterium]